MGKPLSSPIPDVPEPFGIDPKNRKAPSPPEKTSFMDRMNIRVVVAGSACLFLVVADLYIDFCVGVLDTALVFFSTFALYGTALAYGIRFLLKRKWRHAGLCLVLFLTTFSGSCTGIRVVGYQLAQSKKTVESLAQNIHRYGEANGPFPPGLENIPGYDGSNRVDVGLLRKRPLRYFTADDGTGFRMKFPYFAFMDAIFDGNTGKWEVRD